MSRDIVYTGLFGRFEKLQEQPWANRTSCDFVCLTDDPDLRSVTWNVVQVPAALPWDSVRSARQAKVLSPVIRDSSSRSLWIDNRVILSRDPSAILDELLEKEALAIPLHSYRDSVAEEFDAVLRSGFDNFERVRELRDAISRYYPRVLEERPYWTGVIAREHVASVDRVMRRWMDLIYRHSRRDQLSINLALRLEGVPCRSVSIDNFASNWHRWISLPKRADIVFDKRWNYSLVAHGRDAFLRRIAELKDARYRRRNFRA